MGNSVVSVQPVGFERPAIYKARGLHIADAQIDCDNLVIPSPSTWIYRLEVSAACAVPIYGTVMPQIGTASVEDQSTLLSFPKSISNFDAFDLARSIDPLYIQDVHSLLSIPQPEVSDCYEEGPTDLPREKIKRYRHKRHPQKSNSFFTKLQPISSDDNGSLFQPQRVIDLEIKPAKISSTISVKIDFEQNSDFEIALSCQIIELTLAFLPTQDTFDLDMLMTSESEIWVNCEIYSKANVFELPRGLFDFIWYIQMDILGINYGEKYWSNGQMRYDLDRPEKRHNKRRSSSFEAIKRPAKNKELTPPSSWDLLFAVLQAPLDLATSELASLYSNLHAYQPEGVVSLVRNEHFLLADDMGTGKTVMTIVAVKILMQKAKIHHAIVLCPRSVLHQWVEHFQKWAPELKIILVRDIQKEIRRTRWKTPQHVYITTYDTLTGDIENGILDESRWGFFDLLVLDEAHHIKNIDTLRHRVLKKINTTWRWALTGTPIQNKTDDLISIFDVIYPGLFILGKAYPDKEVMEKIKPNFLRRLKKDVLKDLPPKQHQPFLLEMDAEQTVAYNDVLHSVKNDYKNIRSLADSKQRTYLLGKLTTLKQICNFSPDSLSSPKASLLLEQVDEIVKSENKVIVFSQFVEEGVTKLARILESYGVARIVGTQTDQARNQEINKFKQRKDIPILIASVRSGGEGLNLAEASYVVHFDHWWNPAILSQAEDRVHRIGQTRGVNVYSYWMTDTIDEKIQQMLEEKRKLSEAIVDGLAGEPKALALSELWEIFGLSGGNGSSGGD